METAHLFTTGRSQAVRLPKAYRFEGSEVVIKHFGTGVLLLPLNSAASLLAEALAEFEPNFQLERNQPDEQQRAELFA
jgi:antitoxin VapB